ncbi:MAG TPA: hypothetical protein VFS89_08420 [Nitrosospira sp.]|nr:hypothetical protein [Nitrosospira sp.]
MPSNDLVSGEIIFTGDRHVFRNATVYIRLEEVGPADARSRIVAEQVLRDVTYEQGRPLFFELRATVPSGVSHRVRVHIDIDGDGQISPGDYISTESHPVMKLPNVPAKLQVHVHQV